MAWRDPSSAARLPSPDLTSIPLSVPRAVPVLADPNARTAGGMMALQLINMVVAGVISTTEAAHWLGQSTRNFRRLKQRFQKQGAAGLADGRRHPSPRKAPDDQVALIRDTFRKDYSTWTVKHFYESVVKRRLRMACSYSFTKGVLQSAGLVPKRSKADPVHRRQRARRPRFGELLHLDGSTHRWLALRPDVRPTLIVVQDDATSRLVSLQLHEKEDAVAVLAAMKNVVCTFGRPQTVYTDRAGWAGGTVKDPTKPPDFVRALGQLGIEHLKAWSPQARGRGERTNRTLQGRIVHELEAVGIDNLDDANAYLASVFIPAFNDEFAIEPADPMSAFRPSCVDDLEHVFSIEKIRKVRRDNTVHMDGVTMQVARQRGLPSCAGRKVVVRRHLDGMVTVWLGKRHLCTFDASGRPLPRDASACAA